MKREVWWKDLWEHHNQLHSGPTLWNSSVNMMHLLKYKESFCRQRRGHVTLNMEAGESKALNPFKGTILGTYWTIQCFHRMMEKKNYNHLWQVMVIQTLLTVYHLCKERKDKTRSSTKGSLCPSDIPRAHHANTHLMMSRPLQRRDLSFTTHTHVVQKSLQTLRKNTKIGWNDQDAPI